jgi:hypothetical protein
MEQLEIDVVEAFRLIPTFGIACHAAEMFRRCYPQHLKTAFDGLLPVQDTAEQRSSIREFSWPSNEVRFLIERVGGGTTEEFLSTVPFMVQTHLNRQVFILLTTALDSFLDRHGFSGTLGQRFGDLKNKRTVGAELDCDMREVIERRNDVAHGGVVSENYIRGVNHRGNPTKAHESSWIREHGVPARAGIDHDFDIKYLYWALLTIYRLAKLLNERQTS